MPDTNEINGKNILETLMYNIRECMKNYNIYKYEQKRKTPKAINALRMNIF